MKTPQTIRAIGSGAMSPSIAQGCFVAGLSVAMIDADEVRIARARNAIWDGVERMLKKAAPPASDRGAALDRPRGTTEYEALRSCDFIIEPAKLSLHPGRDPTTYAPFAADTCHGAQS